MSKEVLNLSPLVGQFFFLLSVCYKRHYANNTIWIFIKYEKIGFDPTQIPLNFESDLNHLLDTKISKIRISHFLIVLLGCFTLEKRDEGLIYIKKTTHALFLFV